MIQKFVDAWTKNRDLIQSWLEPICLYCDYSDIVKATVKAIALEATGDYGDPKPDFENIHEINDGDYQGTLVSSFPKLAISLANTGTSAFGMALAAVATPCKVSRWGAKKTASRAL